eukprot:6434267-Prymnesium_polylepis.1
MEAPPSTCATTWLVMTHATPYVALPYTRPHRTHAARALSPRAIHSEACIHGTAPAARGAERGVRGAVCGARCAGA